MCVDSEKITIEDHCEKIFSVNKQTHIEITHYLRGDVFVCQQGEQYFCIFYDSNSKSLTITDHYKKIKVKESNDNWQLLAEIKLNSIKITGDIDDICFKGVVRQTHIDRAARKYNWRRSRIGADL